MRNKGTGSQLSHNSNGYLKAVTDVTAGTGPVYWELVAADALGNVAVFDLANGQRVARIYDQGTGYLLPASSSSGSQDAQWIDSTLTMNASAASPKMKCPPQWIPRQSAQTR